ncbi:hypothetical protein SLEP1_g29662 [Rubroshorea leprosula]|uniref:Uncharacterized protein n=1 Tax=Rubroshorea leprosula TaxID=152421 RepID=A0AAV5K056_9ROSI|nr:hypothetical protein SLEP1_g29662 [Rubroshorea leprosula]
MIGRPPPHHGLGVSKCNLVKQYVKKLKDAKRRQQEAAIAFIDANRKFKEKKKEFDNSNKQVKELEEGFGKLKAELAEKGKTSKDAFDLQMLDAVTLDFNLAKELLQFMQPGSEFPDLPLLDIIQHCPSLQNQFNEGDAANIASNSPQFEATNTRANNVEQEDDANDQRMDEAIEADDPDWMQLLSPDGGEDL